MARRQSAIARAEQEQEPAINAGDFLPAADATPDDAARAAGKRFATFVAPLGRSDRIAAVRLRHRRDSRVRELLAINARQARNAVRGAAARAAMPGVEAIVGHRVREVVEEVGERPTYERAHEAVVVATATLYAYGLLALARRGGWSEMRHELRADIAESRRSSLAPIALAVIDAAEPGGYDPERGALAAAIAVITAQVHWAMHDRHDHARRMAAAGHAPTELESEALMMHMPLDYRATAFSALYLASAFGAAGASPKIDLPRRMATCALRDLGFPTGAIAMALEVRARRAREVR